MCQAYIDTYLIVLLTLEQICGKHIIIKQKLFVQELHVAIKHLYTDKVIPHLHSCIDEILTTAILRYEQMRLLEVTSYGNKTGSNTNFLLSHSESRPLISNLLDFLLQLRRYSLKENNEIYEEIPNAITRALGPIPFGKL